MATPDSQTSSDGADVLSREGVHSDPQLRAEWKGRLHRRMRVCAYSAAGIVVFGTLILAFAPTNPAPSGGVAERAVGEAIRAPSSFLHTALWMVLVLGFMASLLLLISDARRVLSGPASGAMSAGDAIITFFNSCLIEPDILSPSAVVEGAYCVAPGVLCSTGGWRAFEKHWALVRDGIDRRLIVKHGLKVKKMAVERATPLEADPHEYQVAIAFSATPLSLANSATPVAGSWTFSTRCRVDFVGQRHFLVTPHCGLGLVQSALCGASPATLAAFELSSTPPQVVLPETERLSFPTPIELIESLSSDSNVPDEDVLIGLVQNSEYMQVLFERLSRAEQAVLTQALERAARLDPLRDAFGKWVHGYQYRELNLRPFFILSSVTAIDVCCMILCFTVSEYGLVGFLGLLCAISSVLLIYITGSFGYERLKWRRENWIARMKACFPPLIDEAKAKAEGGAGTA